MGGVLRLFQRGRRLRHGIRDQVLARAGEDFQPSKRRDRSSQRRRDRGGDDLLAVASEPDKDTAWRTEVGLNLAQRLLDRTADDAVVLDLLVV